MSLDERLMAIAHRLSSQGATLELEMFMLESLGDKASGTKANLERVAMTLRLLSEELIACSSHGET